ncbi:hypothetical protein SNEBB_005251 [Seison nebaliae]|nr:hypothetical protein SNEBB_005251 [Seison nebaliae]
MPQNYLNYQLQSTDAFNEQSIQFGLNGLSSLTSPQSSNDLTTMMNNYYYSYLLYYNELYSSYVPPTTINQTVNDEIEEVSSKRIKLSKENLNGSNTIAVSSDQSEDSMNLLNNSRSLNTQIKPPYSFIALISMALKSTDDLKMTLQEIYEYIETAFPYYRELQPKFKWRNTVRHTLSFNDCFIKVPSEEMKEPTKTTRKRKRGNSDENNKKGKGRWTLHPECISMFDNGSMLRRSFRYQAKKKNEEEKENRPSSSSDEQLSLSSISSSSIDSASSLSLLSSSITNPPVSDTINFPNNQMDYNNLNALYSSQFNENYLYHITNNHNNSQNYPTSNDYSIYS